MCVLAHVPLFSTAVDLMRGGFSIAACSTCVKKVKSEHSTFSSSAGLCSDSWFTRGKGCSVPAPVLSVCSPSCQMTWLGLWHLSPASAWSWTLLGVDTAHESLKVESVSSK